MSSSIRPSEQSETWVNGQSTYASRVFQGITASDWNGIDITYPSDSVDPYTFTRDGNTIATIQLTYSDATKAQLINVSRS